MKEEQKMQNRVRFKIGGIEFEAEGDSDLIARERDQFISTLFPLAVEAMGRTRDFVQASLSIPASEKYKVPQIDTDYTDNIPSVSINFDNISFIEYLKKKGDISHKDFILFAAYYNEKKYNEDKFSLDTIRRCYKEARKQESSNTSHYLTNLIKDGCIIDVSEKKGASQTLYKLSNSGISYIDNFQPKENKRQKKAFKQKKSKATAKSEYEGLNPDKLNLKKYPDLKAFKDFKDKVILVLYIVTQEKQGEWFQTSDVVYILTKIFGESATIAQVKGVFQRQKLWFLNEKIEGNKKEVKRKLLREGIDYSKKLIPNESKNYVTDE